MIKFTWTLIFVDYGPNTAPYMGNKNKQNHIFDELEQHDNIEVKKDQTLPHLVHEALHIPQTAQFNEEHEVEGIIVLHVYYFVLPKQTQQKSLGKGAKKIEKEIQPTNPIGEVENPIKLQLSIGGERDHRFEKKIKEQYAFDCY